MAYSVKGYGPGRGDRIRKGHLYNGLFRLSGSKSEQKIIANASKTNKGRNRLGKLVGASMFRSVEGKFKRVK